MPNEIARDFVVMAEIAGKYINSEIHNTENDHMCQFRYTYCYDEYFPVKGLQYLLKWGPSNQCAKIK